MYGSQIAALACGIVTFIIGMMMRGYVRYALLGGVISMLACAAVFGELDFPQTHRLIRLSVSGLLALH